jgi:hypothetical protein
MNKILGFKIRRKMLAIELSEKSGPKLRAFPLLWICFVLLCITGWAQQRSTDPHTVDFKNLEYPWVHPHGWPDHLQWMSLKLKQHVQLIEGKWDDRNENARKSEEPFSGLTLEEVQYAKLSNDRTEDAIVVLRYDTGGTQNHYWVYIYGTSDGTPKLLGFLHAGDRATHGLYQISAKDRILNLKLFDPRFQQGDCCSAGYLNYRFRWNGQGFEAIGAPVSGRTSTTSRRPVSAFGIPTPN